MAPKTITVVAASGAESSEMLNSDNEFQALIQYYSVKFLVNVHNSRTLGFAVLSRLLIAASTHWENRSSSSHKWRN